MNTIKTCTYCNGKGWRYVRVAFTEIGSFKLCKVCKGFGGESMTLDEIMFEHECKRIDNNLTKYI